MATTGSNIFSLTFCPRWQYRNAIDNLIEEREDYLQSKLAKSRLHY